MLITLKKKGPNSLFDFAEIATIPANAPDISTAQRTIIQTISTDYHTAYIVRAINNADGDNKTDGQFNIYNTGGNHGYDNTGSLSTSATARNISLDFYADGRLITSGQGNANQIEIIWVNRIQGYNTTKSDGSGREILEERHKMIFENGVFTSYVQIIPLEDIYMESWYGFDCYCYGYPKYTYIGGTNRGEYLISGSSTNSGNLKTNGAVSYGDNGLQELFLDLSYDLGMRTLAEDVNYGFFYSGLKLYCANVIHNQSMASGNHYFLKGGWKFSRD